MTLLALVHVSSRYHVRAVLEEARAEFERAFAPRDFDLVEIPFPERGRASVIENGARERGSDETAVAERREIAGVRLRFRRLRRALVDSPRRFL